MVTAPEATLSSDESWIADRAADSAAASHMPEVCAGFGQRVLADPPVRVSPGSVTVLSPSGFVPIAPAAVEMDDAAVMAVSVFFNDGRIEDFPTATMAEEHDGQLHVTRYSSQLTLEWIAIFPVAGITLAQIHAAGILQKVVTGDPAAQPTAATRSPLAAMLATLQRSPRARTGAR